MYFRRSITGALYGILRWSRKQRCEEAINTLGSEFVSNNMSSTEFRSVVQNHLDRFLKGGLVRDWLAGTPELYL